MSEEKSIFKTNHDTEEYESSYDDSEPETTDDYKNIPNIDKIDLSKKEILYFKIIDKYYKKLINKKIDIMIEIIEGKSKISLRLLDWFVTRYAHKNKINYDIEKEENKDNFDGKLDKKFNVHISYKAQLKSFKKRYFDP